MLHIQEYLRIVNDAVPNEDGNAVLFALIVTWLFAGIAAGGWYSPLELIVPSAAFLLGHRSRARRSYSAKSGRRL